MCALKPAFDGTNLISLIFRIVKETPQVHFFAQFVLCFLSFTFIAYSTVAFMFILSARVW